MQTNNETKKVSVAALRRLPMYHSYLQKLLDQGVEMISSTVLAEAIGLDPILVRKDLSLTGTVGKPKLGFVIGELLGNIEDFLGWSRKDEAVLVGCGALGTALLKYKGFKRYNFDIVAAFDNDKKLIGKKINERPILSVEKLATVCERLHIKIGIITVPPKVAQEIADVMIRSGVVGLWDFSGMTLVVPRNVVVLREDMSSSLAILMKKVLELK